ncbi:MAG: ParB N-terminal domain-containing protein, partial [Candidatus Dormiibacterota bacterium]
MSKRKGDFRSKIDSILSEGADGGGDPKKSADGNSLDAMLIGGAGAGSPDETIRIPRASAARNDSPDDALTRLVSPTTETKLDQIDIRKVSLPVHHNLGPTNLQELAASISQRGILQPLLLRPIDGGFEVVDGGKRLIAARALGIKTVPAVVRELSDEEVEATLAEQTVVVAASAVAAAPEAMPAEIIELPSLEGSLDEEPPEVESPGADEPATIVVPAIKEPAAAEAPPVIEEPVVQAPAAKAPAARA